MICTGLIMAQPCVRDDNMIFTGLILDASPPHNYIFLVLAESSRVPPYVSPSRYENYHSKYEKQSTIFPCQNPVKILYY
jgi:hypothetical protein